MEWIDIFLHLDVHLHEWIILLGPWIYVLLFAIIFCETGLVVTPFLPGDSLLFTLGALSATEGSPLSLSLLASLLIAAAILGDASNYSLGRYFGPKILKGEKNRWLNRKHLETTEQFYARHGGKTIILARFLPIIRTFAPFVAGIGKMRYVHFSMFNVVGGVLWVFTFLMLGYLFGNIPFVKKNFEVVVLGIVFFSVLPLAIRTWRERAKR